MTSIPRTFVALAIHSTVLIVPALLVCGWEPVRSSRTWILLILLNLWMLCESVVGRRRSHWQPQRRRSNGMPLVIGLTTLVTLQLSLMTSGSTASLSGMLVILWGSIAIGLGIALRLLAIVALGRFFLDEIKLRDDHQLVCHGVFAELRHPSEAGLLLIVTGSAMVMLSPMSLAVAVFVLLPLIYKRTHQEDRLLLERFGDQFESYRRLTPGWVPCFINGLARTSTR